MIKRRIQFSRPFLLILSFFFASQAFSQYTKKTKHRTIKFSTSLNYEPALKPYRFMSSVISDDEELILTFLTSNSGTFVIEEGEFVTLNRKHRFNFPSQLIDIGITFQIINQNASFHEISLSQLNYVKSENQLQYEIIPSSENNAPQQIIRGRNENLFSFSLKYEFGKYFGDSRSKSLKLGLSTSIESSFYFFTSAPYTAFEPKVNANIYRFNFGISPSLFFKLSKNLSLELKAYPKMLLSTIENVRDSDPNFINGWKAMSEYKNSEISIGAGVLVRYKIKESNSRRKKMNGF